MRKGSATKMKGEVRSAKSELPATAAAAAVNGRGQLGELKMIPHGQIRPDPNQPRKVFDAVKMNELVESIRARGIVVPLLVRWVPAALKLVEPDMFNKEWQALDGTGRVVCHSTDESKVREFVQGKTEGFYQLIYGERRWRAAEALDLPEVPAQVTTLPDDEIFGLQMVENQQRENITALEEAAAYQRRIEERKATDPKYNADALAAELGLSRSQVYSRLALNRVDEPVRKALTEGAISPSVASLVAMVPTKEKQEEFLEEVSATDWQPATSFREAQELLEQNFMQQLKGAPFDQKDADLVPMQWRVCCEGKSLLVVAARAPMVPAVRRAHVGTRVEDDGQGHKRTVARVSQGKWPTPEPEDTCEELLTEVGKKEAELFAEWVNSGAVMTVERVQGGACSDCPRRSGNIPGYPSEKNPNVCTLPSCYQEKCKAHWLAKLGEAKTAGKEVMDAATYRKKKADYVVGEDSDWHTNYTSWKNLMGRFAPAPLLVATETGLMEVYPKAEAVAAVKKNGKRLNGSTGEDRKKESPEEKAQREQREKQIALGRERRKNLIPTAATALAKRLAALSDKESWTLLEQALNFGSYYANPDPALGKALAAKGAAPRVRALGLLFADEDRHPLDYYGDWSDEGVLKLWKLAGVDLKALEKEAIAAEGKKGATPPLAKK